MDSITTTPRVSVLVPIFNTEAYLPQCIESLLNQTFDSIEIILIDDGSTDNSSHIVDSYAQSDERIRVIHKQNSGYGDSLNNGLKIAQGTWIAIVEPDDWVDSSMCDTLLAAADLFEEPSRRIDIVKGGYNLVEYDQDSTVASTQVSCLYGYPLQVVPFSIDQCPVLISAHPSIWSALYRREFLDEFGIQFLPIPGAGWADNPFMLESMIAARSIVYVDKSVYNYRVFDDGSLSHLKDWHIIADRWSDMHSVLQKYDVRIPSILEAHACRGCAYLQMLANDFDNDDELIAAASYIVSTIDSDLVGSSTFISREYKLAYAHYLPQKKKLAFLARWVVRHFKSQIAAKVHPSS